MMKRFMNRNEYVFIVSVAERSIAETRGERHEKESTLNNADETAVVGILHLNNQLRPLKNAWISVDVIDRSSDGHLGGSPNRRVEREESSNVHDTGPRRSILSKCTGTHTAEDAPNLEHGLHV
jgi:hypothetical protein